MPRPVQVYSFADFASRTPNVPPPGDRLDAQFRAHADAIAELHRVIDELKERLARAERPAARETLPTGAYYGVGGPYAGDTLGAEATAADWAQVAIDWAEHLPDTIPGNSLAVTGVSGDHWSSRWWANNAATQISTQLGNYLPLAGGTMAGQLSIPLVSNFSVGGGATGQVLTTAGAGVLAWSTPTGTFIDAPSNSQYYSRFNGGWVVSPGGLTDAPNDATAYARKSQAWAHLSHLDITDWAATVPVVATTLPIVDGVAAIGATGKWADAAHVHPTDVSRAPVASPTFTGTVTLPGPPTLPLHAATKAYVDSGSYLPVSGGTLTGPLLLAADPAVALGAATKQYADGKTLGVTDGSDAAAGQIGEVIAANVTTPVSLTTATVKNVAAISLTAGDWDVSGEVWFAPAGGAAPSIIVAAIGPTSATLPAGSILNGARAQFGAASTANAIQVLSLRSSRISLSGSATYYLLADAVFASGTCTATGNIIARRAR